MLDHGPGACAVVDVHRGDAVRAHPDGHRPSAQRRREDLQQRLRRVHQHDGTHGAVAGELLQPGSGVGERQPADGDSEPVAVGDPGRRADHAGEVGIVEDAGGRRR